MLTRQKVLLLMLKLAGRPVQLECLAPKQWQVLCGWWEQPAFQADRLQRGVDLPY
jgi:hypothetical protein